LFVLLGAACVANAQQLPVESAPASQRLSLPQLLTIVLQSHPLIQAAREQIAVAEGVQAQAASWQAPTFSYDLSKVTNRGGVSELLEFPGKRRLRDQAAGIEVRQARERWRQARVELALECRSAFYQRLLADAQLETAKRALHQVEQVVDAATKQYQAGDVAHLQVIQAKVELARAQQQVHAAAGRQVVASLGLNLLLGRSVDAPLTVDGDLTTGNALLPFHQLLAQALQEEPQMVLAREEANRLGMLQQLAQRQKFPDLNLGVSYGTEEGRRTPGMAASVNIPLPGKYRGQIKAALGANLAALAEVDNARYLVTEQVATAYQQWLTAKAEVDTYKSSLLQQSTQMLKAAQASYLQGQSGLLNVLDAERTDLLVQQQYQQALYNLKLAAAQVQFAVGEVQ